MSVFKNYAHLPTLGKTRKAAISDGTGLWWSAEGCQAAIKMQEKRCPVRPKPEPLLWITWHVLKGEQCSWGVLMRSAATNWTRQYRQGTGLYMVASHHLSLFLALDRKYRHHTETCVNYSACFVACKYYEYFYVLIGFRLVYQFRNLVYASRIHLQKSRPTALKSACPSFRSHCFLLRSNLLLRIWADQNAKGWIDKLLDLWEHPWGQDPLRDQCTMGGSITQYKQ